jgi:uncharacterized protein (TIGR03437 family)
MRRLLTLVLLFSAVLMAQGVSGQFHYRTLEVETGAGRRVRSVDSNAGEWTLDLTNVLDLGGGSIVLEDPNGLTSWNARYGSGEEVILAAKTESTSEFGLLLAVRMPEARPTVSGIYRAARIETVPAVSLVVSTVFGDLDAASAEITVDDSGLGRLSHPRFGNVEISVSTDGSTIVGTPEGREGLFIAIRRSAEAPTSLQWLAEFSVESNAPTASIGSLSAGGSGRVRISQRFNSVRGTRDYRGAGSLIVGTDGTGTLEATPVGATAAGGLIGASGGGILVAIPAPQYAGASPFLHPHGVVSAASLAPVTDPVAPSAFLSLYGDGLQAESAETPTVHFDGRPADVLFASAGQVNVRAPEDLHGPAALVTLTTAKGESNPVRVPVEQSSPAVFSADYSGVGPGMVTHADYSPVSAAAPARRGEIVLVWCAGLGVNQPAPRIRFGGMPGEALFAGQHPDFPGLYQVNARVPLNAPLGDAIPLTIVNAEGETDTVTLAVGR